MIDANCVDTNCDAGIFEHLISIALDKCSRYLAHNFPVRKNKFLQCAKNCGSTQLICETFNARMIYRTGD